MKIAATLTLVLSLAASLAGCNSYDTRDLTGLSAEPTPSRLGSAVFVTNQCPTSSKREALGAGVVAVLASIGADFAVNAITLALEERKKGLNGQFIAGGVLQNGPLHSGQCIVLIRGLFGDGGQVDSGGDLDPDIYSQFSLADYPAFYLEIKVRKLDSSIVLQPQYLSYAQSSARRDGSGSKFVSVVVALSQGDPVKDGSVQENENVVVFRHDLGRLQIGKIYKADGIFNGTGASSQNTTLFEQNVLNLSAVVTESEDAGIALQALTQAFEANKDDLKSAIEDAVNSALGNSSN